MDAHEMVITVYEDSLCNRLRPVTYLRPAFQVFSGASTLFQRLSRRLPGVTLNLIVRKQLENVVRELHPDCPVNDTTPRAGLFVNARVLDLPEAIVRSRDTKAYLCGDSVVAFRVKEEVALAPSASGVSHDLVTRVIDEMPKDEADVLVLEHSWDIVRHNRSMLAADFLTSGSEKILGVVDALAVVMGDVTQLRLGAGSAVEPFSVLDVRDGPIVMGENVTVSAHSTIQGPCYIGDNTVVDAGVIRAGTSIGPVCRLSGEIEGSVFQGFSNKHHLGFMGHAWVGEWVNLGAGTNNSDLKNNYGRVRAGSPAGSVDTGMQKLGCFIGDHTKTGIGSLLNTGAVIGPFCNLLGGKVSPKYLPPFSWEGVDGFEKYRVDEAISTAKAVMRRRSVQMSPHYEKAIVDLHETRDTGLD